MFSYAATTSSEYTRRMRFINHQHCAVSLRQVSERRKRRQVAIHAEQGIRHDQPAAKMPRLAQHTFKRHAIPLWINESSRPRQSATINQACVILGITKNGVAFIYKCRNDAR